MRQIVEWITVHLNFYL